MVIKIFCLAMAILWAVAAIALSEPAFHACAAVWTAALTILLDKDTPRNV
jgi:hypothetical protein